MFHAFVPRWPFVQERKDPASVLLQDSAFIYGAAHDLKAPLRTIVQLAARLRDELDGRLSDAQQEDFQLIMQRAGRMNRLIDDLLSYWRADTAAWDMNQDSVPVGRIVDECLFLCPLPAHFSLHGGDGLEEVSARRFPLLQVLLNIISNAVKHNDKAAGIIGISARRRRRFTIITIDDNGPGIDPRYRKKVFHPFERLKPCDEVEGSGIGLTMVKRMADRAGGRVTLKTSPYGGLRIILVWP